MCINFFIIFLPIVAFCFVPEPSNNELNSPSENSNSQPKENPKTKFMDTCQKNFFNAVKSSQETNSTDSLKIEEISYEELRLQLENVVNNTCKRNHNSNLTTNAKSSKFVCENMTQFSPIQELSEDKTSLAHLIGKLYYEDFCRGLCYKNFNNDSYWVCSFIIENYFDHVHSSPVLPETEKKEVENQRMDKLDLQASNDNNVKNVIVAPNNLNPKEESPDKPYDKIPDGNNVVSDMKHDKSILEEPKNPVDEASGSINSFPRDEDSHLFSYFVIVSGICISLYFVMYNKKKILALVIEGRRRNVKRRPNSAAYSKLDCNLEEAMASGPSASSSSTLVY